MTTKHNLRPGLRIVDAQLMYDILSATGGCFKQGGDEPSKALREKRVETKAIAVSNRKSLVDGDCEMSRIVAAASF